MTSATQTQRPVSDAFREIAAALGPLGGREILEVGCGHGRLAAKLCEAGARVVAVDPDGDAVAAARSAAPRAEVLQAGAESLPFEDGRFDAVAIVNSLHHVPGAGMAAALAEMARVAKAGAPVVIVEPLAEGGFFDAMRPLEDETDIRAAAQRAIDEACSGQGPLRLAAVTEFERVEAFGSLDAFVAKLVSVDPARRERAAAVRDALERAFHLHAASPDGRRELRQPLRLHRLERRG